MNAPYLNEAVVGKTIRDLEAVAKGNCLLICPSADKWNDYGSMLRVDLYFKSQDGSVVLLDDGPSKLLAIRSDERDSRMAISDLAAPTSVTDMESRGQPIVVALGSRRAYRMLIKLAGPEMAKRLLLRANDIAALNAFNPGAKVLQEARTRPGFRDGLLRGEEALFAYISLQKLIAESMLVRVPDISAVAVDLPFDGKKRLPFRFEFNQVLDQLQPLNVLIGPNGMGKTRLLLELASSVLQGRASIESATLDPFSSDVPRTPVVVFTHEVRRWSYLVRRGASVVSLSIAANTWRQLTSILLRLALEDENQFSLRALEVILERVIDIEDFEIPLVTSSHTNADYHPGARQEWVKFRELVSAPSPDLLARIDCSTAPRLFNATYGEYFPSSGQRGMMQFCASLFLRAKDGGLVLIDEPENHMHPAYISLLMRTLASILIAAEARAIVVTHSPFVVREVERNSVVVLQTDPEGFPATYQPSLQTLGGDVAMISDHVFGDSQIRKGFEDRIDVFLGDKLTGQSTADRLDKASETLGIDGARYARRKYKETVRA